MASHKETDDLKEAIEERLRLKGAIKCVFKELFHEIPSKFKVSVTQEAILSRLEMSFSGWNRKIVNESLSDLGIYRVFITGIRHYRSPRVGEVSNQ